LYQAGNARSASARLRHVSQNDRKLDLEMTCGPFFTSTLKARRKKTKKQAARAA